MAAELDLQIWAVIGASGTGKGLWVKQKLAELKPARFVAWDFKNEYDFIAQKVGTLAQLRAAMVKAGDGPGRFRYVPTGAGDKALRKQFEGLCELVYAWQHCVFVAEELANVTTPGWAPASWRKMTTSGRHEGVHIIGCTQSPATVDKSFLGNATLIHCSALRRSAHRQAVAADMDIPVEQIASLKVEKPPKFKAKRFEWIEIDFDSGELSRGWIAPPAGKPAKLAKTRP